MTCRWLTDDQVLAHQLKMRREKEIDFPPDEGPESKLQARIERFCRDAGYYVFHDRSRGENKPGHPDLVIALPEGRVLWLELKSKKGRMSEEQTRVFLQLKAMQHEVYRNVKSFAQFLAILHGEKVC